MRELLDHELVMVAGGDATVTFRDNDRNGRLSEGDEVLHYTLDGVDMTPELYEAIEYDSSETLFSSLGQALDYAFDNPFAVAGFFLDNLGAINRSVELSGSEYIDWKTGGWHNPGPPGEDETNY